jgi:hypothetical protein
MSMGGKRGEWGEKEVNGGKRGEWGKRGELEKK